MPQGVHSIIVGLIIQGQQTRGATAPLKGAKPPYTNSMQH